MDFLDTITKEKMGPFINKSYQELADYTHAFNEDVYEREVILIRVSGQPKEKIYFKCMGC